MDLTNVACIARRHCVKCSVQTSDTDYYTVSECVQTRARPPLALADVLHKIINATPARFNLSESHEPIIFV